MNEEHLSFFHLCSKTLEGCYGPLFQTLGIVLFVLIFNFLFRTILIRLRKRFGKAHQFWALSFVSALNKPLTYFVWFVAALCALDIIVSSLFAYHLSNIHVILSIGAVLSFGWFLFRWNHAVTQRMMELSQNHQIPLTPVQLDLLRKLATITVIFITIFLLLDVTGRNMQTLIAFGGIGGLALAFASQQVVSNFFGGFMVYVTRPFTIGEWVHIPEKKIEGQIEEIGWYLTRIRNKEKKPIYVPNSIFTQAIVITPSRMSHERFHQLIKLRLQDLNSVKPIIEKIKQLLFHHPAIDQQVPVEVFFTNLGSEGLEIDISAYISSTSGYNFLEIKEKLLLQIADCVAQEGAELALPPNQVEPRGE